MHLRLRLLALVAALASLAAACGWGTPDELPPVQRLAAASAAVRDAGSARFELTMELSTSDGLIPPGTTVFASGETDMTTGHVRIDMDMTDTGVGRLSMLMTADAMYMSAEALQAFTDARWLELRFDEAPQLEGLDFAALVERGRTTDPTAFLEQLQGAGDDVTVLGTDTIRGVATTHYRAVVDPARMLDDVDPGLRAAVEASLGGMAEPYPLDVWLDGDGLPRRLSIAITQQRGSVAIDTTMTMELFDYGVAVDVAAPTDDVENLVDLLGRAGAAG